MRMKHKATTNYTDGSFVTSVQDVTKDEADHNNHSNDIKNVVHFRNSFEVTLVNDQVNPTFPLESTQSLQMNVAFMED
jgi:hypothetical protein